MSVVCGPTAVAVVRGRRRVVCGLVLVSPYAFFFFQAEDGIRDLIVTGVQTCALPIHTSELQSQAEDGIRDLIVTGVQTCRSEEHTAGLQSRSERVWRLVHKIGRA